MTGHLTHTGYGILSRVRPTCSHQNLRSTWASEQAEQHKSAFRPQRNKSVSSATTPVSSPTHYSRPRNNSVAHTVPSTSSQKPQDARSTGHWPPLEFDPLKLNPTNVTVEVTEKPPPRLYERDLLRSSSVRTKPSHAVAAVSETRSRPRLHHSDSGISFNYNVYREEREFNFAEEKAKALHDLARHATHEVDVNCQKGWPSPASSVDSGKSWFDLDDDDEDEDEYEDDNESATDVSDEEQEEKDTWAEVPSPQRRPQVGSADDPANYLKRGAWKRRAIFFGEQSNEVYTKQEDAFDIL